jgi:hypothetical protein
MIMHASWDPITLISASIAHFGRGDAGLGVLFVVDPLKGLGSPLTLRTRPISDSAGGNARRAGARPSPRRCFLLTFEGNLSILPRGGREDHCRRPTCFRARSIC